MSVQIPDQMKDAAQRVYEGNQVAVPVRTLLSWFTAERRGYWKVREIRKCLSKLKLKTDPDFEGVWIGASINLVARSKPGSEAVPAADEQAAKKDVSPSEQPAAQDLTPVPGKVTDPVNRIQRLASANQRPLSAGPDATIQEATTLMLLNDFAQRTAPAKIT
jgi:hypothetical protein